MTSPCVGIDLGTTCSAIAVVKDGTPHIVAIDGHDLLPSVALYKPDQPPIVGHPALNLLALHPELGVTSSKRDMGTERTYLLHETSVRPREVAALILGRLAEAYEAEMGTRPGRAVITVPAWFTQAQRADTRAAGQAAGFTVERIINEPTAAALAHAHGQELQRRVLVYDLGGGTFDVSLVEQDGPIVEVKASHGDSRLGGDDIDQALLDHLLERLAVDDPELHTAVTASPSALVRLRLAVERAKVELSERVTTTVRVPFLLRLDAQDRHLEMPLDREELVQISQPLLLRTLESVKQVFEDSGTSADDLDELLLVGGASMQPLVWHLLRDATGLEGSQAIDPRRAVVLGAAIQAAIVDGSTTDGILVDVAPYSLSAGIVDHDGAHFVCRVLTPRNSPLPGRHTEVFYTGYPDQTGVEIIVFQGADIDPRRNSVLALVELHELPPAPDGSVGRPIRVEYRHNLDGMVDITVTDELSGRSHTGKVAADGDEQEELREKVRQSWKDDGLIPGRGEVLDPIEAPPLGSDADAALDLFKTVLDNESNLIDEQGATIEPILAQAREGMGLLEAGEPERAVATAEALTDEMFDLGIYL